MTESSNVLVVFADKTCRHFPVEPKQSVNSFKRIVANSLDIENDKYFGFYFQDENKNNYWLSDDKSLFHYEIFKNNFRKIKLNFSLKFIYQFDYWAADEVTKHLVYSQLKQQLYDGDFDCDSDLCFQLVAMSLLLNEEQVKSFEEIKRMNLISAHLFAKHPSIDYCTEQIIIKYKEWQHLSKEELLKRFMISVLEIPFQMTHFFYAQNFNCSTIIIAITSDGFYESEKNNKFSAKLTYPWSDITNITHHKTRVNIDIQDPAHRSSIRRKSSAIGISYDFSNQNLAKSFVYLAKDICNYMSQAIESMRIMSTTTPRRNINTLKKNANTYSVSKERFRPSTQNAFIPENEVIISRSSSRLSLTSSIYAGSGFTNDSSSLQIDEESLNTPVNLPEKQALFKKLYDERKAISYKLNMKIKEAVQKCIAEQNITNKMPNDIKILDPKGKIKFTKFAIREQSDDEDNLGSKFKNERNEILREMDTLQNIINKLNENPKKHKIEITRKNKELQKCIAKLKELEEQKAFDDHIRKMNRSNSEGCIFPFPNGNASAISNGHAGLSIETEAPMTEPRPRKQCIKFTERTSSETLKSYNSHYSGMSNSEEHYESQSTSKPSIPRHSTNKSQPHINYHYSTFQRFSSERNQIKLSIKPSKNTFHNRGLDRSVAVASNSSSISNSNSSISNVDDSNPHRDSSNSDSENTDDKRDSSYSNPPSVNVFSNHNVRDSREINVNRGQMNHKISNMKVRSRNISIIHNNKNRKSVSLEELREDISETSENRKPYALKPRKESYDSVNSMSKLTYHPSKKDGKSQLVTKGKQPSIIRKAAKSSVGSNRT